MERKASIFLATILLSSCGSLENNCELVTLFKPSGEFTEFGVKNVTNHDISVPHPLRLRSIEAFFDVEVDGKPLDFGFSDSFIYKPRKGIKLSPGDEVILVRLKSIDLTAYESPARKCREYIVSFNYLDGEKHLKSACPVSTQVCD